MATYEWFMFSSSHSPRYHFQDSSASQHFRVWTILETRYSINRGDPPCISHFENDNVMLPKLFFSHTSSLSHLLEHPRGLSSTHFTCQVEDKNIPFSFPLQLYLDSTVLPFHPNLTILKVLPLCYMIQSLAYYIGLTIISKLRPPLVATTTQYLMLYLHILTHQHVITTYQPLLLPYH